MTAAWFCPSCQKYHAPHVETCPGGTGGVKTIMPNTVIPGVLPYRPVPGTTGDAPKYLTGIYNPPYDPNLFIRNGTATTGGVQ